MLHTQSIPWQLKIAAKIVLARLPLSYHLWEKIGLFKQGGMERPEYALKTFRRHFDAAVSHEKQIILWCWSLAQVIRCARH